MEVMLDLETMGNGSRAAIIAIGAVAFDQTGVHDHFYSTVDLESSMRAGMECDASTIMWWMQQSEQARAAFKNPTNETLERALSAFYEFCQRNDAAGMWGNGAAFDNAILSSAYRLCGVEQPWKFWNDKCYRTIKGLYPDIRLVRKGTHHNALDDAISQAEHLIAMNVL